MVIRVVVIEDHPLMMKAILDELAAHPGIEVVGKSEHGSRLPRLIRETTPDVVILDLGMADEVFEPVSAVKALRQEHPNVHVLVLTGYDDEIYIRQIVDAGAQGYILKNDNLSLMLPRGVQRVYEGRRFYSEQVVDLLLDKSMENELMTDQELSVLRLLSQGYSNIGIGRSLNVSEKRIRNLLGNIYAKLEVREDESQNTRVTAINAARARGLLN